MFSLIVEQHNVSDETLLVSVRNKRVSIGYFSDNVDDEMKDETILYFHPKWLNIITVIICRNIW